MASNQCVSPAGICGQLRPVGAVVRRNLWSRDEGRELQFTLSEAADVEPNPGEDPLIPFEDPVVGKRSFTRAWIAFSMISRGTTSTGTLAAGSEQRSL